MIDDVTRANLMAMRAQIDALLAQPAAPPPRAPEPERIYLTPEEYAERVGLTSRTVRRMIRDGEVDAKRFGRRWRIPASELTRERPVAAGPRAPSATVTARKGAIQ